MGTQGKKRELRKGFTTGTAAAAGAKAAATALFTGARPGEVSVTLPSGDTLRVKVAQIEVSADSAAATVVKDAGDDPDVTNKAEIIAEVKSFGVGGGGRGKIRIEGGEGVGRVTRKGLQAAVGEPAINRVPLRMIKAAVREVTCELTGKLNKSPDVVVTIRVPRGRELAVKTMNPRLGIVGGISILGTTGIVEPLSHSAYTDSIICALDVAVAEGLTCVVLSTGRSSEKAVEALLSLPPSAFILTGDHMGFALKEVSKRNSIKKVTIAAQFGKLSKLAQGHFDTHSSRSGVDLETLARYIERAGAGAAVVKKALNANTAREVFFLLKGEALGRVFRVLAGLVKEGAGGLAGSGVEVGVVLADYNNEIVVRL